MPIAANASAARALRSLKSITHTQRMVVLAGVMSLAFALSACSFAPKVNMPAKAAPPAAVPPAPPAPAPQVNGLPELMHQAETALAAGDKSRALDAYQAASKIEPTSKLPWLKLAESYFEARDYGNAVLAAQEVLHRDSTDSVAASILAVSGLRVSSSALAVLRQQNSINPGTRSEAELLTQNLRDLLKEQVLVPPLSEQQVWEIPVQVPPRVVDRPTRRRARPAVPLPAEASVAGSSQAPVRPPSPLPATSAPVTRSSNPFDVLK